MTQSGSLESEKGLYIGKSPCDILPIARNERTLQENLDICIQNCVLKDKMNNIHKSNTDMMIITLTKKDTKKRN